MSECICIFAFPQYPILIVTLLQCVTSCFPKAVFISSGVAKDKSLFLITPLSG